MFLLKVKKDGDNVLFCGGFLRVKGALEKAAGLHVVGVARGG